MRVPRNLNILLSWACLVINFKLFPRTYTVCLFCAICAWFKFYFISLFFGIVLYVESLMQGK